MRLPIRSVSPARGSWVRAGIGFGVLVAGALLLAAAPPGSTGQGGAGGAAEARSGLPAQVRGEFEVGGRNRTDYRIHARLADDARRVEGWLELEWTNGSEDEVGDLWFHTYLNAFASDRSTHARVDPALGDRLARVDRDGDGFGGTSIRAVWLLDGDERVDLLPSLTWERPLDGNSDDFTVFRVELPRVVGPREQARVRVEWLSDLPRAERRTGRRGDFLLVAQWFPKLGVYEEGRGWNCHQFHAWTEWYADFGSYRVSLDLPARYAGRVGATGKPVSTREAGERVELVFEQPFEEPPPSAEARVRAAPGARPRLVHDFTWTADPRFQVSSFTFEPAAWAERFPEEVARANQAFGVDAAADLSPVEVVVLMQRERAAQAERHFEATAAALFFYGLWYGPYPYGRITVVDPAFGSRAGGMEYPMLFTAGTRLLTRPSMHVPESVTIHEAGHQWFYGLIANNEFEAAFLDEGLNSYADSEVLARVYGPRVTTTSYAGIPIDGQQLARIGAGTTGRILTAQEWPLGRFATDRMRALRPLGPSGFLDLWRDQPWLTSAPRRDDPRWADRTRYLESPDSDPIDTLPWEAKSRTSHYRNVYPRTAVALRSIPALIEHSLPGEDGWAVFARAMRGYALEWRFRHPYPDDFFRSFQRHMDVELDLDWYFEKAFRGVDTVDWSIAVERRRVQAPRGLVPAEGGPVDPRDFAWTPRQENAEQPERPHAFEVTVHRRGTLALPVPVRLTFSDGSVEERLWTREEQLERPWLRLAGERTSELVSAQVDPERGYYLDLDLSNNQWFADSDGLAPIRWAERAGAQALRRLHFHARLGG